MAIPGAMISRPVVLSKPAGRLQLGQGACGELLRYGRHPAAPAVEVVLVVAPQQRDVGASGGVVEPPAQDGAVLDPAIDEVACEDVEDVVAQAVREWESGTVKDGAASLQIADMDDRAVVRQVAQVVRLTGAVLPSAAPSIYTFTVRATDTAPSGGEVLWEERTFHIQVSD
jgi:hypothetical protein